MREHTFRTIGDTISENNRTECFVTDALSIWSTKIKTILNKGKTQSRDIELAIAHYDTLCDRTI